jgi:hypothetical protein
MDFALRKKCADGFNDHPNSLTPVPSFVAFNSPGLSPLGVNADQSLAANISLTGDPLQQPQAAEISIRNLGILISGAFMRSQPAAFMADNHSLPTPRTPPSPRFGPSGTDDRFAEVFPADELDIGWGRQAMDLGAGPRL